MHHWMWQIIINCTLLHHHLSLSGKTQVSLRDKSPNQYISLGLQVICSWVMWNLSQVSQRDKINNQAAQKVFLLNSGHKKPTQKWKCELNTDHAKLKINSRTKIYDSFICITTSAQSQHSLQDESNLKLFIKARNISEHIVALLQFNGSKLTFGHFGFSSQACPASSSACWCRPSLRSAAERLLYRTQLCGSACKASVYKSTAIWKSPRWQASLPCCTFSVNSALLRPQLFLPCLEKPTAVQVLRTENCTNGERGL